MYTCILSNMHHAFHTCILNTCIFTYSYTLIFAYLPTCILAYIHIGLMENLKTCTLTLLPYILDKQAVLRFFVQSITCGIHRGAFAPKNHKRLEIAIDIKKLNICDSSSF